MPLIDQLGIDATQQPLTQKAIIKAVQDLTEIMDRTIKAMKGSPDYEKEKEKQVQRFAKLLEPYHKLMVKWVIQLPTDRRDDNVGYYNSKELMLSVIGELFDKLKNESDPRHLNPSGKFSVGSVRIDSATSFVQNFIQFQNFFTLEDLFTLYHQNILTRTVFLSKQIALEKLPETIRPLVNAITEISAYNKKTELLNIDHVYPVVKVEFNLPLRTHSAKFLVKYNQETKKTIVEFNAFGENYSNRMDFVCILASLDVNILNLKAKQKPSYDENSLALNFSFELDKDNISFLVPSIKKALQTYAEMTIFEETVSLTLSDTLARRYSNDEIKKSLEGVSLEETEEILKKFPKFFIDLVNSSEKAKALADRTYDLQNPSVLVVEKLITQFGVKFDFVRKGTDDVSLIEKLILSNSHTSKELLNFIVHHNMMDLLQGTAYTQAVLKRRDLQLFIDLSQKGAKFNLQDEETKRELIRTIGRAYFKNDVDAIQGLIAMDANIFRDVLLNYLKPEQTKNFTAFKQYLETSENPIFIDFAKTLEPQALIFSRQKASRDNKEEQEPSKPKDNGPNL